MSPARALFLLALCAPAAADATAAGAAGTASTASIASTTASEDVPEEASFNWEEYGDIYNLTAEEYYSMPQLFHLDEYSGCLARGGVYCVGSFELAAPASHQLFSRMKRYSEDWVQHYNHTRLHRGLCLSRRCPLLRDQLPPPHALPAWFASCVNATTMAAHNISAELATLDYCTRGDHGRPLSAGERPFSTSERSLSANARAFAVLVVVLLVLAIVSTTLDLSLSDHAKKGSDWALCWSLRRSWAELTEPARGRGEDLRFLDGLRLFAMLCVILEHVGWLATQSYVADTRFYEEERRSGDVMLLTNSTLVVQIFFIMASFLLASKLLQQPETPCLSTFLQTMLNRLIRLSPSYFVVLWFAGSWWELLGEGPLWAPLVAGEAAVCRRKLWTHLLYVNNLVYPDDKCLIQTWYLAADVQLYAAALLLTLLLRGRRALPALLLLFVAAALLPFGLAYAWRLMPTYVVHAPESVRRGYAGDRSFNVLYQSPLGNAAGALAGLLLAHAAHRTRHVGDTLAKNKLLWWAAACAPPAALAWAALSPLLLPPGPPPRAAAAALASLERPVFVVLVALGVFGGLRGVDSPVRKLLQKLGSGGGAVLARLSYGALLLHLPLNKALLAARLTPAQIDRTTVLSEWFGVAAMSYAAALPLALLVELPALRLHRELRALWPPSAPRPRAPPPAKTDS